MALMFIGGASGSTAGGIKVNTFSVLLIAIVSTVRGRPVGRGVRSARADSNVIFRALAVALLSIAFVFIVAFGIEIAGRRDAVRRHAFEAISAFATVGLTTGITPTSRTPPGSS